MIFILKVDLWFITMLWLLYCRFLFGSPRLSFNLGLFITYTIWFGVSSCMLCIYWGDHYLHHGPPDYVKNLDRAPSGIMTEDEGNLKRSCVQICNNICHVTENEISVKDGDKIVPETSETLGIHIEVIMSMDRVPYSFT
ncbi:hypothetical protein FRX31_010335 [Thalictrum thalictroides]|uniref:Uncharacterized protein n=1 Tax=Thalictrum thalictroides TaxID=46969 RepID=A0A7J6WRR6_THATH|nr:hypothetical protein FRX31_010335 [Thalictrum thalictroides]